jgi:16S rRNA (guanine1516-N2)-methyltransferase
MLLTTTYRPDVSLQERAQEIAGEWGIRYVDRGQLSIPRLKERYFVHNVIVIGSNEVKVYSETGEERFFHPSLAMIRMKRLLRGEHDVLMDWCEAKPGDIVIDGTAGLGADAMIFSHRVGPQGQVHAVESEFFPSLILAIGARYITTELSALNDAMKRLKVYHQSHLEFLKKWRDQSADIVYFDPMFHEGKISSSAISGLRLWANPDSLSALSLDEARRVARRWVVIKDSRRSPIFNHHKMEVLSRGHGDFTYGRLLPKA